MHRRIDAYLQAYRRQHASAAASVVIQAAWRGRRDRESVAGARASALVEAKPVLRAWRLAARADRRWRRGVLSTVLWRVLHVEALESRRQAVLKQALTSVQCGECFDVFDVQMPSQ